jgi:long-subunit fatty acid transport protein
MPNAQSYWLLVTLALFAGAACANAQQTNSNSAAKIGTSGAPVATGHGPLSQPVPPAVSTANPRQNAQQGSQRPQDYGGPAQTSPWQQPFGSR